MHPVAKESFDEEKRAIIQSLIDYIDARFQNINTDPVFTSSKIFDPKNWPADDSEIPSYGQEELDRLLTRLSTLLKKKTCNLDTAREEWLNLKIYLTSNYHIRALHPLKLWKRVLLDDANRQEFSNILMLVKLVLVFPLSTAVCERGFSTLKRAKSDWRCPLSTPTIDDLMRVSIEGPSKLKIF